MDASSGILSSAAPDGAEETVYFAEYPLTRKAYEFDTKMGSS